MSATVTEKTIFEQVQHALLVEYHSAGWTDGRKPVGVLFSYEGAMRFRMSLPMSAFPDRGQRFMDCELLYDPKQKAPFIVCVDRAEWADKHTYPVLR